MPRISASTPIQITVNGRRLKLYAAGVPTEEVSNTRRTPLKMMEYKIKKMENDNRGFTKKELNIITNRIILSNKRYLKNRLRNHYKLEYTTSIQDNDGIYATAEKIKEYGNRKYFDIQDEQYITVTSPEDGEEVPREVNLNDVNCFYLNMIYTYRGGDNDEDGYCFWKLIRGFSPIQQENYKRFLNSADNKWFDKSGTIGEKDLFNIERVFKINIYVTGDIFYQSKVNKKNKSMYFILQANHWMVNKEYTQKIKSEMINKEGYKFNNFIYEAKTKEIKEIENEESNKYLNIIDDIVKIKDDKEKLIEYARQYEELKELTTHNNYSIDLLKFGSINAAIRHHINLINRDKNIEAEPIYYYEYEIFANVWGQYSMGEPNNRKNGVFKNYYHYDVSSCFPYILKEKVNVPLKAGKKRHSDIKYFQQNLVSEKLAYGFYKCKITKDEGNKYNKFIRATNEWYTNIDLYLIYDIMKFGSNETEIKGKIELIDEEYNFMQVNQNETISGKILFGQFIDRTYKLKRENPNNKLIKMLLARIHSAFIETDKKPRTFDIEGSNEYIEDFKPTEIIVNVKAKENKSIILSIDTRHIYKSNFARMKNWLYSYQRKYMWDKIKPYLKTHDIRDLMTDGFYSDKPIPEFDKNNNTKYLGQISRK